MKGIKFALLLAAYCTMLAAAPLMLSSAEIAAAGETDSAFALPDWVPTDYESAKAFLNELAVPGSVQTVKKGTRIVDGLVCIVYEEQAQWDAEKTLYSFSFTPAMFEIISDTFTESRQGYGYHIYVLQPKKAGTADVYNIPKNAQKTPVPFRFQIGEDLSVTEIKLPQWLPADFDSAWSFYNSYGKTRISDGLLCTVFYEYVPGEASWRPEDINQLKYSEEQFTSIFSQYYSDDDENFFRVDLFKPIAAGDASVVHDEAQRDVQPYEYTFHIDENLSITETDLCGWLPDCSSEFFGKYNNNQRLMTHGNQVAFLLETTAGTGYSWKETSLTKDAVSNLCSIDCSELRIYKDGMAPSGGAVAEVRVFQIKKDGAFELQLDLMPPGQNVASADTLGGTFYALDHCSNVLKPDESRVTFIDADTGKPVLYPFTEKKGICLNTIVWQWVNGKEVPQLQQYLKIMINSGAVILGDLFQQEHYKIWMDKAQLGYHCNAVYENGKCDIGDEITVKMLTDTIADITVKVHFTADGDINGNGSFDIEDTKLLRRWLLGDPNAKLKNWKAADFCNDDCLNACDLTAMKQALITRRKAEAENGLILIVNTSYGGAGIDGRDLGSGHFETVFNILEGDCFYEDSRGHWYQNVRFNEEARPILTIKKIESTTFTVSVQGRDGPETAELELGTWTSGFPYSGYVVYDGINYSYDIRFESNALLMPVEPDIPMNQTT